MTIRNILAALEPVKPIGTAQLHNYLRRFKIKPIGTIRLCPQQYPDDTADQILARLGLKRDITITTGRSNIGKAGFVKRSNAAIAAKTNGRQPKHRNGNGRK